MIGPKKFMKGHHKTFAEQTTWRPIPAIGQNYPHPPFRLGSTCYPTEPIPSILLTESARGGTQVDKIRGYATRSVSSFGDEYWNMGADAWVGRKKENEKSENSKIFEHSRCKQTSTSESRNSRCVAIDSSCARIIKLSPNPGLPICGASAAETKNYRLSEEERGSAVAHSRLE